MLQEQVKILCVKLGISLSGLARLCGSSPQAFGKKLKRGSFSPDELKQVAEKAGCKYETKFILPNGDEVTY